MKNHRKTIRKFALAGVASVALFGASVQAQEQDFNIKAQSLGTALSQFAVLTNQEILFSPDVVAGRTANAVVGRFQPSEALEKILADSGLTYEMQAENVLLVKTAAGAEHATEAEADTNKNSFVLEEIIVTATRRAESLQDVPMSINAFGSDRIKESGVNSLQDIQFLAAGLHVNNGNGSMRVTIRGIGSSQLGPGAESGAAVHRDGIYLASFQDLGMSMYDVERIEVLRGPQGTLYGRNATGGAVNIISKSPTSEFEGGGEVTFGNYNLVETEGYVSGPLMGDKLLARIAFKTRDHEGFTPNIFDGDALDDGDFSGVRAKLGYEPSGAFHAELTADYSTDSSTQRGVFARLRPDTPLTGETMGAALPSGRAVNLNDSNINEKESWGLTGKAEWGVGSVTVSSLTGFRKFHWLESFDSDASPFSMLGIDKERRTNKQFSQEITVSSSGESNFQWVGGAYYFHSSEFQYLDLVIPTVSFVLPVGVDTQGDAYAVFGEGSYDLSDRLSLTLAARYSFEEKSIDQFVGANSEQLEDSWKAFTPKAALSYVVSDELTFYATVGKGFKAGGFNGNTLQGQAYDPEEVVNYEAGLKASLFDRRVNANLSAFYMDYTNLQVLSFGIGPSGIYQNLVSNAATAVIQGMEVEVQAYLSDALSFDGNFSFLDATYNNWPNAVDQLRDGADFDVSGNQLSNAPKWAANIGLNYMLPVGDWGTLTIRGEYSYKSRIFFTPFEDATVDHEMLLQDGFNMINARLTFEDAEGRWRVSGWMKNIGDALVATDKSGAISGVYGPRLNSIYLPPRTYGISVGYSF